MPRAAAYMFLRVRAALSLCACGQACSKMNGSSTDGGLIELEVHGYPQPSQRDASFDCGGRLWQVDC